MTTGHPSSQWGENRSAARRASWYATLARSKIVEHDRDVVRSRRRKQEFLVDEWVECPLNCLGALKQQREGVQDVFLGTHG